MLHYEVIPEMGGVTRVNSYRPERVERGPSTRAKGFAEDDRLGSDDRDFGALLRLDGQDARFAG